MKKVKQIGLLQTKEKLNQNKTISHLANIELEVEKCLKVENELEEIAKYQDQLDIVEKYFDKGKQTLNG